ncbi:MAG: transcription antitermination factor NusB [Clostridia bacterium]|nr:transcription antitermination factor NusB [Clostridia bacterium]
MRRKQARAEAMQLVYEQACRPDETPSEVFDRAMELRQIEPDPYMRELFFGVCGNLTEIDAVISRYSNGWRNDRISSVAMAVMRVAVYEIRFRDDVPGSVAVNEAIELIKEYDDAGKLRKFVNGVLNAVMKDGAEDGSSAGAAEHE